jgi:hypothetical protein
MTWVELPAITLNQFGNYAAVPVPADGGRVTFRVPPFAAGETGRFKIGAYSGPANAPEFIEEKTFELRPYGRFATLNYPAGLSIAWVGLQLVQAPDLTASYPVVLSWQSEPASGLPQGSQILLGITFEALQAQIAAILSAQAPTYAELETLFFELEAFLISSGGAINPDQLAEQLDPFLATDSELSESVQAVQSQIDEIPNLVLLLENQLV